MSFILNNVINKQNANFQMIIESKYFQQVYLIHLACDGLPVSSYFVTNALTTSIT